MRALFLKKIARIFSKKARKHVIWGSRKKKVREIIFGSTFLEPFSRAVRLRGVTCATDQYRRSYSLFMFFWDELWKHISKGSCGGEWKNSRISMQIVYCTVTCKRIGLKCAQRFFFPKSDHALLAENEQKAFWATQSDTLCKLGSIFWN